MNKFVCVVLAAGKGKRMKSGLTKVLHPVCGKPMLFYVLRISQELTTLKTVLVVGRQREQVMEEFKEWEVIFVDQVEPLGTGDAVLRTEEVLEDINADIIVLAGDTPLLKETTIEKMMELHARNESDVTLLSTFLEQPEGYGRIIRDGEEVVGIKEEKDTTELEKSIKEINAGVYIFNKNKLFQYLRKIKPDNIQKEYYLTDVVKLIQNEEGKIQTLTTNDWRETIGINDRVTLTCVSKIMRERMMEELMKDGVTFISPDNTVIDYGVKIGKETVVNPFVSITGETVIGESCTICSHTTIHNSLVGKKVKIGENCLISNSQISDNTLIPVYSNVKHEEKKR